MAHEPGRTPAAVERDAAFARHVLPEVEVLYRVARSITGTPHDAEDLVQDTLLRAYRAADRFDGRHPRAWLLTILRNAQINRVRRRRPGLLTDPDDAGGDGAHPVVDPDPGPEQQAMDRRFDAAVAAAFRALPDRFRAVVALVDLDGLSYEEAADALGIPTGTVMSRLHRARRRMRAGLGDSAPPARTQGAAP